MRSDHKKTNPRKEENKHRRAVPIKKQQVSNNPSSGGPAGRDEKPIKGKDIDLLNYTDL